MNHPNHEELVDFLDGELSPSRQAEITSHLTQCDECNGTVIAWRQVRQELQTWKLSDRQRQAPARSAAVWQNVTRIAASIALLATGFALARWTAPTVDANQLRAEVAAEVGDQLRGELQTELTAIATTLSREQQAYQLAIRRGFEQLDARWLEDFTSLRKDIETVAVRTQEEFARRGSPEP